MKHKFMALAAAAAVAAVTAAPSFAGMMGGVGSVAGATTATFIDIPEGVVVDSLYRCPKKAWKSMAYHLGDNHDHGLCWLGQQTVGMTVGVPVGMFWGVPYGAFHGGHHAWESGWEKPFSMESFTVSEDK